MNPAKPHPPAPDVERLNFWTKLSYGTGTIGTSLTGSILAFFFMFFLTDVAGLPAAWAGSVLMIGQISDAISDPIIGLWSDRTKSRWGRRYPWILAGAVPFGLSFLLLWLIPSNSNWLLFVYYVVIGIVFKTAFTAVYLPYVSLTPDLTQGYHERTSLNSFRFTFSIGSSILALALVGVIFDQVEDLNTRYLVVGAMGAVLCIVPLYLCVWGTHRRVLAAERRYAQTPRPAPLALTQQVRIAFSNRPFLLVMGIYLCSWLAAQMTAVVMQYFVVSWMNLSAQIFTYFALTVQGTALSMLFVWSFLSQRVGKKVVYFLGVSLWIIAQGGLFFLQPGQVSLMFALGVMAGFGVSTAYLVPWSMLPDVIELDELKTGQRREGVFYAFMVMVQKVGLAIGIFLVGQVLSWAGYVERIPGEPSPVQPASALLVIRLAIGPIPTLLLILGLVLAYFYPISRELYAKILLRLSQRRLRQQRSVEHCFGQDSHQQDGQITASPEADRPETSPEKNRHPGTDRPFLNDDEPTADAPVQSD
ncbi:MAG: MFS transporter [Synechococcales bacterium]|nr:MFS transporter [Synechococcales bacterium]